MRQWANNTTKSDLKQRQIFGFVTDQFILTEQSILAQTPHRANQLLIHRFGSESN